MGNNRYSIGLIIVAVGIILLLGKLGVFSFFWHVFWPLFVLAPGLILHVFYFNRTLPSAVLVPGGILITISILFFTCTLFGWGLMAYLWPVFVLAPAVGLYELYFFDRSSPRGVLIASLILAAVAAVMFSLTLLAKLSVTFIAIVLIAVGAYLLLGKKRYW